MYRAVAPTVETPARSEVRTGPLRLARVVRREFGAGTCRIDDPAVDRYFWDLAASYDIGYRPEVVKRARGNTFAAMAAELWRTMGPLDDPIELAVVAHATPDLDPRRSIVTHLAAALPGPPLAFAVADHGVSAAFTALRVVAGYARRHGYRRALVLVVDQATLPYDIPAATAVLPARDAAVALVLEETDAADGVSVATVPDVEPGRVPEVLARLLPRLLDADGHATVIAGSSIEPDRDLPRGIGPVRRAPMGFPCTGIWAGIADEAPRRDRTVLVDYDRDRGELCVGAVGDRGAR